MADFRFGLCCQALGITTLFLSSSMMPSRTHCRLLSHTHAHTPACYRCIIHTPHAHAEWLSIQKEISRSDSRGDKGIFIYTLLSSCLVLFYYPPAIRSDAELLHMLLHHYYIVLITIALVYSSTANIQELKEHAIERLAPSDNRGNVATS